jgi:hypothetical protein
MNAGSCTMIVRVEGERKRAVENVRKCDKG